MLETITLHGFKSFADRTRLDFGPGVCAVIGPNGSGKSNVVEALRWVTHGARARELRAGRGSELIFHGSGGKAPLGLAEVTLEVQTPGGRLRLARRLYRDGSSEQDLNGRPARARDVQSALRGTGLGQGGLAVIGQGEVGSVVQAEGRTLLGYLQEAAGLSRSVAARLEAQARLSEAQDALAQMSLIMQQQRERLDQLARAAQAARRWDWLSARSLLLDEALARERQLRELQELARLRGALSTLLADSQRLSTELTRAAQVTDEARARAAQVRAEGLARQSALDALESAEQALQAARQRQDGLTRQQAQLHADRAALDQPAPPTPRPDLAGLSGAVEAARQRETLARHELRRLESELSGTRLHHARWREAQAHQAGAQDGQRRQRDELRAALDALAPDHQQAAHAAEAARPALTQAAARLQALEDERAALRERLRSLEAAQASAQAARAPLTRERERLDEALSSFQRYSEGPRQALRSNHPGIVGAVAELLRVPADYELAVSAALGRRLEQVVVRGADDARAVIEHLRRVGGRATFLPLELLRPRPRRDGSLRHDRGVLGNLADLCPSDPPLVAEVLLGDTLLLDSLETATLLARRQAQRPRLVTLAGELLEPGGAMTGGRLSQSAAPVLEGQRRQSELLAELQALQARLVATGRELADAATLVTPLDAALYQARRDHAEAAARDSQARSTLAALEATWQAYQTQLARMEPPGPAGGVGAPTPPAAEPDLPGSEARTEAARQAHAQAAQHERELSAAQVQARELAAAWDRHQGAQARRGALMARQQELSAEQQAAAEALRLSEARRQEREAALGGHDPQALPRELAALQQATEVQAALLTRQNTHRARLEEASLTLARREGALGSIPDGAALPGLPREWQAERQQVAAELATLGAVNFSAAAEHAEHAQRLADTAAQFQDAQQAVSELGAHLSELEAGEAAATAQALTAVAAAFAQYSGELLGGSGELVAERDEDGRLLGLALAVQPAGKRTRSLALLSAGERTMAGLGFLFALNHAGGERSSGGLPLAVLDEVDAPLDEANIRRFTHFLTLFAQRGAQFLLVTHQKATMEVATALWGVTTDSSGASRALSIRREGELVR